MHSQMASKHARVAIVRPPVDVLHRFSKRVESLALAYLASALRADGHEVVLLDGQLFDWTAEETCQRIEEIAPDIVGFTVVLNHFPDKLIELLNLLEDRALRAIVLVGGHSVSFFPQRILSHVRRVDGVISGEGDTVIRQIAAAVADGYDWRTLPGVTARGNDGSFLQQPPRRVNNLDELPMPARDLTAKVIAFDGVPAISTSRGCYARCTFCSVPRFYGLDQGRAGAVGAWLARSAASIVSEIEDLYRNFSLRELLIVDDEFFGGTEVGFQRGRQLAELLKERGFPVSFALSCRAENAHPDVLSDLQRAGLSHVFIGLEAGTQQSLRLYGKRHTVDDNKKAVEVVKSLGLSFQAGFMMFNSHSTLQDLSANIAFLREIGEFKPLTINSSLDPHFGTPILHDLERQGVLTDNGLSMSTSYRDPEVAAAKLVAEMVAVEYEPFMSFLAAVRSSITYQWRRQVPGRTLSEEKALDAFENATNVAFSGVVERTVESLLSGSSTREAIQDARTALRTVREDLRLAQGLLVSCIAGGESSLRYWSQGCLIRHHAAQGG